MSKLRTLMILAVSLAVLLAVKPPVEAQPPASQGAGSVGKLPVQDTPTDELVGWALLVSHHVDRAVEKLAKGDIKEFTQAWVTTQKAYGMLADAVSDAAGQVASAEARLEVARARFTQARTSQGKGEPRIEEAARSLEEGEKALLESLSRLRTLYNSAGDEVRATLAAQMQDLVGQVETLRSMRQEIAQGQSVPRQHAELLDRLEAELSQMESDLAVHRQVIHAIGKASDVMIAHAQDQVRHIRKVAAIKGIIPDVQQERIEQLRASMSRMQEIVRNQKPILDRLTNKVTNRKAAPVSPETQKNVLGQVDALLGIKKAPEPEPRPDK